MKKIVRLTESDLIRIISRVVNENREPMDNYYKKPSQTPYQIGKKWDEITDDYFFTSFIRKFRTREKLEKKFPHYNDYWEYLYSLPNEERGEFVTNFSNRENFPQYEKMITYLEDNFSDFPGEDDLYDFFKDLETVNW